MPPITNKDRAKRKRGKKNTFPLYIQKRKSQALASSSEEAQTSEPNKNQKTDRRTSRSPEKETDNASKSRQNEKKRKRSDIKIPKPVHDKKIVPHLCDKSTNGDHRFDASGFCSLCGFCNDDKESPLVIDTFTPNLSKYAHISTRQLHLLDLDVAENFEAGQEDRLQFFASIIDGHTSLFRVFGKNIMTHALSVIEARINGRFDYLEQHLDVIGDLRKKHFWNCFHRSLGVLEQYKVITFEELKTVKVRNVLPAAMLALNTLISSNRIILNGNDSAMNDKIRKTLITYIQLLLRTMDDIPLPNDENSICLNRILDKTTISFSIAFALKGISFRFEDIYQSLIAAFGITKPPKFISKSFLPKHRKIIEGLLVLVRVHHPGLPELSSQLLPLVDDIVFSTLTEFSHQLETSPCNSPDLVQGQLFSQNSVPLSAEEELDPSGEKIEQEFEHDEDIKEMFLEPDEQRLKEKMLEVFVSQGQTSRGSNQKSGVTKKNHPKKARMQLSVSQNASQEEITSVQNKLLAIY